MKHIEDHFGKTCYTTGGYTPEGFAALSSLMKDRLLPPAYSGRAIPEIGFRSMNFVKDWNFLVPEH